MNWGKLFSIEPIAWFQPSKSKSSPTEVGYEPWLKANFPNVATKPLSPRHHRLWRWFDGISAELRPAPRVEVWPRGGAKSSTGELGCVYVGTRLSRRFVLYVSETQDQADKHVRAVASLFEKIGVGRLVGRYGNSKGWSRNEVRTETGFNVSAYGLDTAARGVKLDEYRPDLIIFDDIDSSEDGDKAVRKKIRLITTSVLPAGSTDCAVLFLQNLIHEEGVVARLVDGRAEFLNDREVPEIEPAVRGLKTERFLRPNGAYGYRIIAGEPTWVGQDLKVCEEQINRWGLSAFLREAQHQVRAAAGKYFDVDALRFCKPTELPKFVRLLRCWDLAATQGGGDYTVGVLMGLARNGVIYILDVKRHQFSSEKVRELILGTAIRDAQGEVFGGDEYDEWGQLVSRGRYLFSFEGAPAILIPQDPGQAGKAQADQFDDLLDDYEVIRHTISGKKAVRARGSADKINAGNVVLVEAAWNKDYIDEHRKFTADETHAYDDQVDPTADGVNEFAGNVWEVH